MIIFSVQIYYTLYCKPIVAEIGNDSIS